MENCRDSVKNVGQSSKFAAKPISQFSKFVLLYGFSKNSALQKWYTLFDRQIAAFGHRPLVSLVVPLVALGLFVVCFFLLNKQKVAKSQSST